MAVLIPRHRSGSSDHMQSPPDILFRHGMAAKSDLFHGLCPHILVCRVRRGVDPLGREHQGLTARAEINLAGLNAPGIRIIWIPKVSAAVFVDRGRNLNHAGRETSTGAHTLVEPFSQNGRFLVEVPRPGGRKGTVMAGAKGLLCPTLHVIITYFIKSADPSSDDEAPTAHATRTRSTPTCLGRTLDP